MSIVFEVTKSISIFFRLISLTDLTSFTPTLVRSVPNQGCTTAVSSDTPSVFHLQSVATMSRADNRSANVDSKKSAAMSLNSGVLRGSAVIPPEQPHLEIRPGVKQTIVMVDVAKTSRRFRDPSSVNSLHKVAMEEGSRPATAAAGVPTSDVNVAAGKYGSGSSDFNNSSAFRYRNGMVTKYSHRGSIDRSVTPMLSSHQRLTSLEDTLSHGTHLWTTGPAGYVRGSAAEASSGQSGMSATGEDAEIVDGRWPRPSPVPRGASFNGLPRSSDGGFGYAFTTGLLARKPSTARFSSLDGQNQEQGESSIFAIDRSAAKAIGWTPTPQSEPSSESSSVTLNAAAAPHLLEIPKPLKMLRPKAETETFISRASKNGVSSRSRASNLDASLGLLVTTNAAAAAKVMGHALPGSALGVDGTLAAIATASVNLPADAVVSDNSSAVFEMSRRQMNEHYEVLQQRKKYLENVGGGGSVATNSVDFEQIYPSMQQLQAMQHRQQQALTFGSSNRGLNSSGGYRSSILGSLTGGPQSTTNDVPRRATTHPGGESWTTRESYTLAILPRSEEMLRAGALQARFTARLHPHHEMDLTHGFVDQGLWSTMNFTGNSKSPTRRPLNPTPLPTQDTLNSTAPSSQEDFPPKASEYGYGEHANAGVFLDGKLPPLGSLMRDRTNANVPSLHNTNSSAARVPALDLNGPGFYGSSQRSAEEASELAELDEFDLRNGAKELRNMPDKTLKAMIEASGVAHLIGMGEPGVLSKAKKAELLLAIDRIPAAKMKRMVYGSPPKFSNTSLLEQSLSSLDVPGTSGVQTQAFLGHTSRLQAKIQSR